MGNMAERNPNCDYITVEGFVVTCPKRNNDIYRARDNCPSCPKVRFVTPVKASDFTSNAQQLVDRAIEEIIFNNRVDVKRPR